MVEVCEKEDLYMKERNFDSIQVIDLAENSIQLSLVNGASGWITLGWTLEHQGSKYLKWLRIVERKVQNQFSNCCIVSEIIYVFLFNLSKLYFLRCTILWRQMLPRDVRMYVLTRMKKVQANKSYQVAAF